MYESSTNWTAIIIVSGLVYGIVFAVASGFIASTKNRDVSAYVMAGFFLGIIGLIIAAAVPKLEPSSQGPVRVERASSPEDIPTGDIGVGTKCVARNDILIDGETAFYKGNYITVDRLEPESDRPEHRFVVYSNLLEKEVHLSGKEIFKFTEEPSGGNKRPRKEYDYVPFSKTCPYCAETIKAAAIKCRYCGSDLAD